MARILMLLRAAGFVLTLAWAGPAMAQVQPCPPPAKQPPAGSPVLLRCMEIVAHPVNETLVDGQTYAFYIRTPQPDSANDRWVPYNEESILADFNSLWKTNFLENLWIEVLDEPYDNGIQGKHVIFHIEERNRVKAVDYAPVGPGAKLRVDVSKIDSTLKERNLEISLDTFVDEATIRKVVGVIRELYAEQGYNDAIVEPTMREVAGGSKLVDLRFNIREGPKVRLREVVFDGNKAITDDDLRGQLKENRPRSRILILVGGGQYREDKFAEDAEKLGEYYRDRGYAGAQIGSPQIETLEVTADGKTRWIRLRVPVEEGPQFRVGEFTITEAKALRGEGLRPFFELKEGDIYSLKKLRQGFEKLKELYGAFGYYQWAPDPELKPRGVDEETGKLPEGAPPIMDINVKMNEGKQFFVNRITFVGNHTTRDPVIRRELRIAEGAVFNSEALKESVRRLNQLGYFKPLKGVEGEMDVTPAPGMDDKLDVKMRVEEQNRNSIAFGAGVSQFEGVFGQLSFQTSNFLGRGETLGISLQKGARARQYQLSFSEPYLWDRPITAGFDVHSRQYMFIGQYTQRSSGGNAVLGLPLADYTRLFLGYSYEQISVFDVNPAYTSPQVLQFNPYLADSLLIGQGGQRTVSKVSPSLVFNTVNQPIFPTAGRRYSVAFDFAGLGGNTSYNQVSLEGIWYFKLPKTMSLGLRAQTQYIRPYGTTTSLPIFEKVFLGGEYNIRGYDLRSISPRDPYSGVLVGGNKSVVLNAEYYIDIGQVRVLAFYDAGQVRDVGQPFRRWEPVRATFVPADPILVNLGATSNLLTEIGAIRTETIGRVSATRTSTGLEARFIVPFINIPFRLIAAYNPQRLGVINNNGLQTPRFTFRFAVGTTF
ncbi:MAG: outer membrane protein assembly factor BamA [Acidobacteria bacterium]|nr:outer membrane protein assembly factor BamA [Acidobacteriota bacterium]